MTGESTFSWTVNPRVDSYLQPNTWRLLLPALHQSNSQPITLGVMALRCWAALLPGSIPNCTSGYPNRYPTNCKGGKNMFIVPVMGLNEKIGTIAFSYRYRAPLSPWLELFYLFQTPEGSCWHGFLDQWRRMRQSNSRIIRLFCIFSVWINLKFASLGFYPFIPLNSTRSKKY